MHTHMRGALFGQRVQLWTGVCGSLSRAQSAGAVSVSAHRAQRGASQSRGAAVLRTLKLGQR